MKAMIASMPEKPAVHFEHIPVLWREIVEAMEPIKKGVLVDGTLGLGGHSERLLQSYPHLKIIGFDWDAKALAIARTRLAPFGDRVTIVEGSYADSLKWLTEHKRIPVDGLLVDLGLSSLQLSDTDRGFSFLRAGPFDMRMSSFLPRTAWDLVHDLDEASLADVIYKWGEEPQSRKIAHALKEALHQKTLKNDALEVALCIRRALSFTHGRIDPATRTFQALRIAVNGELDNVDRLLAQLPALLAPGGRAAIISFHSLEDRRVKHVFHEAAKDCLCPPTLAQCECHHTAWARLKPRKAIQARLSEIQENPRSRSARLRVLEKR
jgi:16S rRNA (cytosine1402-N4)-methyltransferase